MSAVQAVIKAYGRPEAGASLPFDARASEPGAAPGSVPLHAGSEVCAVRLLIQHRNELSTAEVDVSPHEFIGLKPFAVDVKNNSSAFELVSQGYCLKRA